MFEEFVSWFLVKYLGEYIEGLNREHLRISLFSGKVEFTNLRFKTTALNRFRLPVTVKEGFLGKLVLTFPAKFKFGAESVVVQMSQLFLIVQPKDKFDEETEEEVEERLQQIKQEKLRRADEKEEEYLESKKTSRESSGQSGQG
eukprot:TRINITY_DN30133_c0_g1_i1.p2 TRINITY_DN30133_c0_g1~~TRINITY_DN30133_c0_g1_i1.p2  ORF type:complete len:144 (-),score=37.81 TRINITY_DN30133_c0_g1_i1:753-1184(-)